MRRKAAPLVVLVTLLCQILSTRASSHTSLPSVPASIFGLRGGGDDNNNDEEISMGTTLVALKFQDGVVVAADTRTSVSGYVSNKFARKINVITDNCVLCRSGSAADTQYLAKEATHDFMSRQWRYYGSGRVGDATDSKQQNLAFLPTISQVSHFLRFKIRQTNQGSSSNNLQASLICAGIDEDGPHIFGITPGGSMWEEEKVCVSGSGSTYLLGLLDDYFQSSKSTTSYENNMTKDHAVKLITKLLHLSMARDGSSGGIVRIMVLTKDGIQEKTIYPDHQIRLQKEEESTFSDGGVTPNHQDLPGFAPPVSP